MYWPENMKIPAKDFFWACQDCVDRDHKAWSVNNLTKPERR